MKLSTLIIAALALFIVTTGCTKDGFCIKGKGEVVSQEIELGSITGFHIHGSADVQLTQGEAQSITIEAQQNIIDNFDTRILDGVWQIEGKDCYNTNKNVTIFITIPDLTDIVISGSGDVTGTNTFTEETDLLIDISGSGDVDLAVEATRIDTRIDGSGDVELEGSTTDLDLQIKGSGNIRAFDIPSENCIIDVDGSGDCRVQADQTLDVNISGSGTVWYKGDPSINVDISGSGDLINAN